jgi:hypothetical protein
MTIVDFVDLFCYIVTMASIIVKLTPTPKDDLVVARVRQVLECFALNSKGNNNG